MPRGLVHVAGSERCVLSHPGRPTSQTILEIRIRRGGISIQGPAIWAVPGSPHFYAMHGCGSLPSAIDGSQHAQLPWRLAHSGPVAGGFNIAQDPPPQPLRLPGAQGQLCQEHTVTQQVSFVPGHSYRLSADDSNCLSGVSQENSAHTRLPSGKVDPLEMGPPLSSEQHDMASMAQVIGPACVDARREPFRLPKHVLNTMAEARAPSTRRLYALKWSIFSAWCQWLRPGHLRCVSGSSISAGDAR